MVGDTVWFDRVQCALIEYKPDVIIVNACAATLVDEGRLIMNDEDIAKISEVSPMATIIASHMDTVAHAMLNRLTLKDALMKRAVHNVKIIGDGEVMHF